jgi:putative ABC transport system permease protein
VVREFDPGQPAPEVIAMTDVVSEALGGPRFAARVFAAFALVALLLAAVGLYGLIAHSVERRTREIGVRVSLGARPSDVVRPVLAEGLGLAILGTALGLAGALAGARLLSSLLFGVSHADALTQAAASALLISIAALVCALPAWRALRIQPSEALRHE